ncbi:MAG: 2,3,4,5-tetrahydropyridine-2,6-dicarboxylate N-succinyltransferase [Nitrospirota bacterium]|nr:2,3,4,5-tetrahydropyridine-2,6-dicarboxylate N-succinyltransferase [Nitrospirota bacterium]
MSVQDIEKVVEQAWDNRDQYGPGKVDAEIKHAVLATIDLLDRGEARVASKESGQWVVHQWLKKAVLLYFKLHDNVPMGDEAGRYFDKVPLKYAGYSAEDFKRDGVRVVPPATVRKGAFIAPSCILMPSYTNIGAYVDQGTLVDTWATVGSCAQIGKRVHLSGGTGIGGVLEPLQANPVIIEDNCFIGARAEVAEGVIVEEGSVISMGVYLGASTKIVNRETGEITLGRVPAYSVVVPGTLPGKDGGPGLYCAVIVKQVDAKTRSKTGINELLREF